MVIASKIRLKFWFFRNYWWLLTALFMLLTGGIVIFSSTIDSNLLLALGGTFLSLVFFLQRQRLDEIKLFRKIFANCNERYDTLNEKLNDIVEGSNESPLDHDQRATLMDYFNLCGEEWLYYREGYLFPEVWTAWFNGMKHFVGNERIAAVWRREKETDSYYGLPL